MTNRKIIPHPIESRITRRANKRKAMNQKIVVEFLINQAEHELLGHFILTDEFKWEFVSLNENILNRKDVIKVLQVGVKH